jgi:hypothetical protein
MVMDLSLLFLRSFLKSLKLISLSIWVVLLLKYPKKPGYRFRFFDRNGKLIEQGIALQQFQPFQFVNSNEVAAEHGLDVVHFGFVGGCVLKNQVVINRVKNPFFTGMFE